jgi:hypothetical protein
MSALQFPEADPLKLSAFAPAMPSKLYTRWRQSWSGRRS